MTGVVPVWFHARMSMNPAANGAAADPTRAHLPGTQGPIGWPGPARDDSQPIGWPGGLPGSPSSGGATEGGGASR